MTWKQYRESMGADDVQAMEAAKKEILESEMTLRELRQSLGLTQQDLAENLQIAQPQLSKMEGRGDHKISTLKRAVEAMGMELEVFAVSGDRRVKLNV